MWPVLFTWRGIILHSYQVMIYLALLVTVFVTVALAQGDGLNADRTALAVLLSYVPAFIGARLLYAARHWDHFRRDPSLILRRSEGGLSLYGGITGMFAGLVPLLWAFGLPAAPFFDALVPGMLAGIAVAKGGCLLNGCCHGHETGHWCSVDLPDGHGVWRRRFPVQLMEMAWALLVLLLMLAWRNYSPPPGLVACGVFVLHPAGRIVLQNLRDEGAVENAAVRKTCMILIAVALAAGLFIWL
jgi:phosphatidylglycerol:prolipoprotein diacylglycerol transferase